MTQLDFSLAQPRQNIDLATPLNMYMKMKQEKRAQNQDKYLQRQQARQEQKQMDVQDLATMTLDPWTGEPDRKAFYTGAMEMGYMDIAENARQTWAQQDKAKYQVEQLKREDSQKELQRMGTLAKAALEAYPDNPRMAATRVLETQAQNGVEGAIETLEGLQMASDEEIRKNLDFLVKQSEDVDGGKERWLSPIEAETAKGGEPALLQVSDKGRTRRVIPPEGVKLTKGVKLKDMGGFLGAYQGDKLIASFQKTIPPEQQPGHKGKVAGAVQKGMGKISDKEKKLAGQKKVSGHIKKMAMLWKKLDKMGSAISTEGGTVRNIANRLAASDVGQGIQSAYGGKAQSIRNQIQTLKPALILAIKNANPSIGAKGMDTPRELDFYLSAIGNEQKDIESNMAALIILEESMGLSSEIKLTPAIEEEMNKLKSSPEVREAQMEDLKAIMPTEPSFEEQLDTEIEGL